MTARLQKILSAHGVASRREAERLIRDGRVTVNGNPATPGQSAQYGYDEIAVDGAPLGPAEEPVYIMLNKPRGYITTVSDDRGRPTVMSLVTDAGVKLYPVGRLDMDSEGLLLLTNDGDFAEAVAHPSGGKVKTYEVTARGYTASALAALNRPMVIDTRSIRAASAELMERAGDAAKLRIAIHEGRNRQIRKMCAVCGLKVQSLKRVAIGALVLGLLETGQWRRLTEDEVLSLTGTRDSYDI